MGFQHVEVMVGGFLPMGLVQGLGSMVQGSARD